jgi:hypothetical protein
VPAIQLERSLESYIRNPIHAGETRIFDTITLHQPDVSRDGLQAWVSKVEFLDSLYLMINDFDGVLRLSDLINDVRAGLAVIREACRRMIRGVPGGGDFHRALDGAGGFTLHEDTNRYLLS